MKRALLIFITSIIIVVGLVGWLSFNDEAKKNIISKQSTTISTHPVVPSYIDTQLANMTLKQKIASLLILHKPGTDAASLKEYLATYQPGGLIFMGDNIPSDIDQLTALTSELQTNKSLPYLFAVDEEGGIVKRLPDDTFPAAVNLKNQPLDAIKAAFSDRSTLVRKAGLNLNFGIVADITDNPNSFIYSRVFGSDPIAVSDRVAAAVKASKSLTLSTLKHFSGHGEAEADSHISILTTDVSLEQWQTRDKPSFLKGVEAGADAVMFGHLRYSSVDNELATLSVKWHDILREQLGFKGLIITDDMGMLQNSGEAKYNDPITNAISALRAGNTMLLYVLGNDNAVAGVNIDVLIDGIVEAVKNDQLSQVVIDQDARQVLDVRHSLAY